MSEERQKGMNLLQRMYSVQMLEWMRNAGLNTEDAEFMTKEGIDAALIPDFVINGIAKEFPNARIGRVISGVSRTDFHFMTAGGRKYIYRITRGEMSESKWQSISEDIPVSSSPRPPLNAEFVLHLLLKRDEQDVVIGDILERYVKKHKRLGERRANLWFYAEVFRSVWPLLRRAAKKWGGLALLGEWVRRMIQ